MNPSLLTRAILATVYEAMTMFLIFSPLIERQCVHLRHDAFLFCCTLLTLSCSANERTEMKLKIYLSEAWMCSEFGMLITDVERERVNKIKSLNL